MATHPKSLLVLFRHAPYGKGSARGGYDLALAAAALEQPVELLFMDDGVWHLVAGQEAGRIDQKSIENTLASLPLYDVATFHADQAALTERGIDASALVDCVKPLEGDELKSLIASHDQVLVF